MTKREMFNLIASVNSDNADIVEFCNHEISLLNGRKSNSKPSKTQVANEGLKNTILAVLAGSAEGMTVTEVIKAEATLADLSNQKVSALLRQLMAEKKVIKTIEKKVARFSLA